MPILWIYWWFVSGRKLTIDRKNCEGDKGMMVRSIAAFLVALVGAIGLAPLCSAYTLLTEDAESGTANILTNVSGYPLIQSEIVGQGSNAFHLANPGFQDNWFVIDETLTMQADTKLFFLSRLGWATSAQVARVQVSTNGGASWPTNIYNQAGTGGSGEGSFSLKEL